MKKTKNGYMGFTRHSRHSFTWHYRSKQGDYFKFFYFGFGIREARKQFIKFIKEENVDV